MEKIQPNYNKTNQPMSIIFPRINKKIRYLFLSFEAKEKLNKRSTRTRHLNSVALNRKLSTKAYFKYYKYVKPNKLLENGRSCLRGLRRYNGHNKRYILHRNSREFCWHQAQFCDGFGCWWSTWAHNSPGLRHKLNIWSIIQCIIDCRHSTGK